MADISYKVEGLEELLKKLDKRELLGKPLKDFWERAAFAVVKFSRLRSPFRTGRLQDSIVHKIDTSDIPLWAEVGTGVTDRGVSYPVILEMSDKMHYRATGRMGQPTKGWFSNSLDDSKDEIQRAIDLLGNDMEAQWLS